MNQYIKSAMRRAPRITIICGLVLFVGSQAWADVLGRLHFSVKNAADEKPIAGATITLKDSANVHAPIVLKTDDKGSVTTDPINARAWHATTTVDGYVDDDRDATVVADTTTEVEVLLEPKKETERVIKITAEKNRVNQTKTDQGTVRDNTFQQKFPVAVGNPQSLTEVARANPGVVQDSAGQLHPRGEHSATSIYIMGFRLPGAFQMRAGQVISPSAIQSMDLMTGAYAPEYGGETAAIMNLDLRAGTLSPFESIQTQGGTFGTVFGDIAAGGQLGQAYGVPTEDGKQARRFSYMLDVNARQTDNALEPPQPDDQTAHNHSFASSGFGNFDFHASDKDTFALTFDHSPAKTGVANRTGLPDSYAPYGQGYGFGGALTQAQAEAEGIGSQQADGQDINQYDTNTFGVLSWRRNIDPTMNSFLAVGLVHAGLDVTNNNPFIDLNNLPADNSIEYNPTIRRNSHDVEVQGFLTKIATGGHTFKLGFNLDSQNGNESYQLIPGSVLAENALANIDPRLAPINGVSPTLSVHRTGYYNAAYIQDTWRATNKFTANYGFRLDMFKQDATSVADIGATTPSQSSVSQNQLSPRLNMSYLVAPRTVARAAYNRLFITPPQAEGSILGTQIKPETLSQYDLSVERQLTAGQVVKAAYYYKDIRNQIDTGLLIPGTQIGVQTSVQFDKGSVRGLELSYDLVSRDKYGWNGFLAYTNSIAKPGGLDNTGAPAPTYNDHDQLNTISTGADYTFHSGYTAGIAYLFGSGVESSKLTDTSSRVPHHEVDLNLASRPDLIAGRLGLAFQVENLFDSRQLYNFNSGFSGTRFQEGRRILFSLTGKF